MTDEPEGRLAYAEALTHVARQIVGAVLVSWQRTLRTGLIAAAITLFVAEIGACLVTNSFPPPSVGHLVAGALAVTIGYSAALTTLFALLLRGGVRFIHRLEGDMTVGAEAASVFAQREVGDLGAGIRRFFQNHHYARAPRPTRVTRPAPPRPATKPRPAIGLRGVTNPVAVAAVGVDVARVAMPRSLPSDVRRDPDDAVMRTPAPAMQSLPVLASRLPRIGWTYDEQLSPASLASFASAASAASAVPPAFSAPAEQPHAEAPAPPSSPPQPEASAPATSTEAAEAAEVAEAPVPAGGTPDAPGLIPRGWRRPDTSTRATRPLPAVTHPLGGARSGGLWDRVSQALVGQAGPDAETEAAPETTREELREELREAAHTEHLPIHGDVAPEDAWLNG